MSTITLDYTQLPHLVRLLEDETPSVREAVLDALAGFGPELADALTQIDIPLTPGRIEEIRAQVAVHVAGDAAPGNTDSPFRPGQVVRHARYGYRGVIVAVDPVCQADDSWYQSNQTQPAREQPWFHVLVHNAGHVTYAAQENLIEDLSGDQVNHPYVAYFFSEFQDGAYVRNDQPWPS